jgi:hypothetical protein
MGAERGEWGKTVSLAHLLPHIRVLYPYPQGGGWVFSSQFKIFCSIEVLSSVFRVWGGGGANALYAASQPPKLQAIGKTTHLKGPKHEIFESVFFYTNQTLKVR